MAGVDTPAQPPAAALVERAVARRVAGDVPGAIDDLELAYRTAVAAGPPAATVDPMIAARAAVTLAELFIDERGEAAVAQGWIQRARHHLPDGPSVESLQADIMESYLRFAYDKDPVEAEALARRAAEQASSLGDPTAIANATAYLGLILVSQGRLREGQMLLDDATATAAAGELPEPDAIGIYCILITACERIRDFGRVDQWATRVFGLADRIGDDSFAALAQAQHASVQVWRGQWAEAESTLARLADEGEDRPVTAAMGMVALAGLRRRQGRLDDADDVLTTAEREPYRSRVRHLVLTARAAIELDRGNLDHAADVVERYLASVKTTDVIERVDGLEVLVRARALQGDVARARQAAEELAGIAEMVATDACVGAAEEGAAWLAFAQDAHGEAAAHFAGALGHYDLAGLPYEVARAGVARAQALLAAGRRDDAVRQATDALQQARALGAAGLVARAERLADTPGGSLADPRDDDTDGLTSRELEILRLIARGRSNQQIATELVLSVRTVERHVNNLFHKLGVSGRAGRAAAAAWAARHGID